MSLYPTEVGEETVRTPQRDNVVCLRLTFKLAGLVAVIIVGILGLVVTAQAAGIDVFDALGR